jgi:hypothetical protein
MKSGLAHVVPLLSLRPSPKRFYLDLERQAKPILHQLVQPITHQRRRPIPFVRQPASGSVLVRAPLPPKRDRRIAAVLVLRLCCGLGPRRSVKYAAPAALILRPF